MEYRTRTGFVKNVLRYVLKTKILRCTDIAVIPHSPINMGLIETYMGVLTGLKESYMGVWSG